MLVGTDVCILGVFMWEEIGIPGGNPTVWPGDHMTISLAEGWYWTRVAAVRDERFTTTPARQILNHLKPEYVILHEILMAIYCVITDSFTAVSMMIDQVVALHPAIQHFHIGADEV